MNIKNQVVDSVRWLFIAQLLSQLVRIGVTLFVIRNLENGHMAFIALAQTVIGFLEMFSGLGLNASVISRNDITKRDLSNISGMLLLVNAILAILVFSVSGVAADFYQTPELEAILKVLSFGFIITSMASVPTALLTKQMRFKAKSIIQFVSSLSGAAMSFVLVINGFQYWSIVIGGLTILTVGSILRIIVCGQLIIPRLSLKETLPHLSFGSYVMFAGIAWYFFTSLDVIIAGKFWTPETLGIYAVAVQLAVMPLSRILPLLKQVALPAFSMTLVQDKTKLQSYLAKSVRISMAVCLPVYFGISSVALVAVPIFLSEKWAGAALPLMCLCIAAPFRFFLELQSPAVIATGNPKQLLVNSLMIASVMISLYFVAAILSDDPLYLALVWMIAYPILSIYSSFIYCRIMKLNYIAVIKGTLNAFYNSIAMWLVVAGTSLLLAPIIDGWLLLLILVALGIFSYLTLTYMTDRKLFSEYKNLLRSGKRKKVTI